MKTAVIFCSGDLDMEVPFKREETLVICADGGYRHAKKMGIVPDMIIGDCDSFEETYPEEIPHLIYPSEKDETDAMLCLNWAIKEGCDEVWILGGLGGRLDHEFSNFALLMYGLKQGVTVKLANHQNEIWMTDKPVAISPGDKKYISFFPYGGEVEGFSLKGFRYEVDTMTLTCDTVRCACNEFVADTVGEVSFTKGYLLIMCCQDKA